MDDLSNSIEFKNNFPVIKIVIAKTEVQIRVLFSMNCCKVFFNSHELGDDYRTSFVKSVFHMYKQNCEVGSSLAESDFLKISESDLHYILDEILEQDDKVKSEYEKIDCIDIYEKFFTANKIILNYATVGISKSLERISEIFESLNKPLLTSISSAMNNFVMPEHLPNLTSAISMMPHYDFPKLTSTFYDIPKLPNLEVLSEVKATQIDFSSFQTALNSIPEIQFPELASVLSNISKPIFDIQAIVSPLQNMVDNDNLSHILSDPLSQMAAATQKVMSNIDFSLLIYRKEWSEQRETLLKYGWFYSEELPEELINDIHARQKELSVEHVNNLVVLYFRQNKCEALKKMLKQWDSLHYFSCRKRIFHEALVNHSRKYFNTSVTLLTIHTEGVITDFVRTSLKTPRFKLEKAIEDIKKQLDENENVSLYEFEAFNDVIAGIEEAFTENFVYSDPDAASNRSRHKIAHGHAYETENEVNSLKRFLYLNEIHNLFFKLSNAEVCN